MTTTIHPRSDLHEPFIPASVLPHKFIYIMFTDGNRCVASNFCGEDGITYRNQWSWIVGHMIQEFGCDESDVGCIEMEDGDRVTVCGEVVAYLAN